MANIKNALEFFESVAQLAESASDLVLGRKIGRAITAGASVQPAGATATPTRQEHQEKIGFAGFGELDETYMLLASATLRQLLNDKYPQESEQIFEDFYNEIDTWGIGQTTKFKHVIAKAIEIELESARARQRGQAQNPETIKLANKLVDIYLNSLPEVIKQNAEQMASINTELNKLKTQIGTIPPETLQETVERSVKNWLLPYVELNKSDKNDEGKPEGKLRKMLSGQKIIPETDLLQMGFDMARDIKTFAEKQFGITKEQWNSVFGGGKSTLAERTETANMRARATNIYASIKWQVGKHGYDTMQEWKKKIQQAKQLENIKEEFEAAVKLEQEFAGLKEPTDKNAAEKAKKLQQMKERDERLISSARPWRLRLRDEQAEQAEKERKASEKREKKESKEAEKRERGEAQQTEETQTEATQEETPTSEPQSESSRWQFWRRK